MIEVRSAAERGRTDWGWLDSRHTFSFGDYYDPAPHGLPRRCASSTTTGCTPGAGFGTHGHRDMEILSYVLEGALEHKDSSGGGGVIRPGEIQFMRAGTGVTHSEYNASKTEPVHFLQIWIVPDARGLAPGLRPEAVRPRRGARRRSCCSRRATAATAASRSTRTWSLVVALVAAGERRELALRPGRHAWVHVARGSVVARRHRAAGGRRRRGQRARRGCTSPGRDAEVLVFDLA